MKKILVLIVSVICLTGCVQNNQLDEFSNLIIDAHHSKDVSTSNLNSYNKEVFINFMDEQNLEKKVINLSNMKMFGGEDFETSELDTNGVYFENGKYYIKYTDLDFVRVNDIDIATVIAGGYEIDIYKDLIPVLYTETDNEKYNYRFMGSNVDNDIVNYYYRSYGDSSMLTIRYEIKNDKIIDVDLIYDYVYSIDKSIKFEDLDSKVSIWNIIFTVLFIVIVIVLIVIYFIKRKKKLDN